MPPEGRKCFGTFSRFETRLDSGAKERQTKLEVDKLFSFFGAFPFFETR